jgi:hypothetical protein
MNPPLAVPNVGNCWKTYGKAAVFLAPALLLWLFVITKCLPVYAAMIQHSGATLESAGGAWPMLNLLARNGTTLLVVVLLGVYLLEKFSSTWRVRRDALVTFLIWIVNAGVLTTLGAVIVSAAIAFPHLLN